LIFNKQLQISEIKNKKKNLLLIEILFNFWYSIYNQNFLFFNSNKIEISAEFVETLIQLFSDFIFQISIKISISNSILY